jgi:kynurenine formamidase
MKIVLAITVFTCLSSTAAVASVKGRIVDLTYAFSAESVYWPTADGFSLQVDSEGVTDQGYYYTANSFSAAEHGGTHLDAPVHFSRGMPTVDEIDLERLIGPGVVIDVSGQAAADPDYLVNIADIRKWESEHGEIPQGSILFLRTGWGSFYPDKKKYLGTDQRGSEAVSELHFPGLDPEAAEWLVKNRNLGAIGLDTASIDRGQSSCFRAHQVLFGAGIPALENVANLELLPEQGFQVIALPMKIKAGSGAPVRIIAVLP